MKKLYSLVIVILAFNVSASDVPTNPPSPCYEGCTQTQEDLINEFHAKGVLPERTPAVYSGVCNHTGLYNPEIDHYSVVLLDENKGEWNFSAIYGYFLPENEFSHWDLTRARAEMSPYWKDHGNMTIGDGTARVRINYEDGNPAYVYWMRQHPVSKELLLISYAGNASKSFCRLKQH
ncbi:MAG: hypothetical protein ACLGHN_09205 [Bacteriovoracia bacterium]